MKEHKATSEKEMLQIEVQHTHLKGIFPNAKSPIIILYYLERILLLQIPGVDYFAEIYLVSNCFEDLLTAIAQEIGIKYINKQ